ncbi:MAG: acyloxyacyl hydrolase [Flavobacteriaceae bacterium]|nr:acyloxyacyl hydrolase [Flavobacteriaceae bacterium]
MNKIGFFILVFCLGQFSFSQEKKYSHTLGIDYTYGHIMLHRPNIAHLLQGPTNGFLISWEQQTYGFQEWEQRYNYPSYGASFFYQNMGNSTLGDAYSIQADYRFYFWQRRLSLRVGSGIAYMTNPFDINDNPKNTVYGSTLLGSFLFGFNYEKRNLWDTPVGVRLGGFLMHYSNGRTRSPNTSTNNYGIQLGLTYDLNHENQPEFQKKEYAEKFTEPVQFNFQFSSGMNDAGIIGESNRPFVVLTGYADKRLNAKSAVQLGVEGFFTSSIRHYIRHQQSLFPNNEKVQSYNDWRRVGLFVGHELFAGKLSLITQAGYYVYYPIDYLKPYYTRVGLKRYFNDQIYVSVMLKTHMARAEAMEYGVGIRF